MRKGFVRKTERALKSPYFLQALRWKSYPRSHAPARGRGSRGHRWCPGSWFYHVVQALAATWSRLLSGVSRALRWKMLESRPGPGQLALDGVPPRQGRGNGPTMTGRGWGYLSAVPSLFQVLLSFQTSIRCMKPGDAKPQATPYILDASTEGWERQARDLGLMSV